MNMMKFLSKLMAAAVVSLSLTGCGMFKELRSTYQPQGQIPSDAYGTSKDIKELPSNGSLSDMSWREFFTDPKLQQLIEQVLANNTDLNSARIAVEKSEESLKVAKLAYLPSLYFSPQGTLSSFDFGAASKTYNLPLQLSMDIDAFGSIAGEVDDLLEGAPGLFLYRDVEVDERHAEPFGQQVAKLFGFLMFFQ